MIAVDWGTTSFRAYRLSGTTVLDRRETPNGILHVEPGAFPATLRRAIGPWLGAGETRVLMAGMVGSRQGWREAPYLPCPAGLDDLAMSLTRVDFAGADVRIVPGLTARDQDGVPEVMRGEEAQLAAVIDQVGQDATVCLPGSHSKWAGIRGGHVIGFATHMTGEAYAALRQHTILARQIEDAPTDMDAFRQGVVRSVEPGGLLHHVFGVRTLGLFEELGPRQAGSYLSGLLIGHEVRAATPSGTVHLVGAPALCTLYALAIAHHGARAEVSVGDEAARGLAIIGGLASWD